MTLLHSPPSPRLYNLLFALIFSGEVLAEVSPRHLNDQAGDLKREVSIAQADQISNKFKLRLEMPAPITPTTTSLKLNYETVKLPGGEAMGWVGANLMFDVSENARLGVGTHGAMAGHRGGFITLGVAGELRRQIYPDWFLHTGLFVGAGGGRGGYTLSGGGLMLRADLGVDYQVRGLGNLGLGVSHVEFPDGVISSTQPYVQYEYPFSNLVAPGWQAHDMTGGGGWSLASHLNEFSVVGREYMIPSSVHRDNGAPQSSRMQLVGVEWLTFLDDAWFLKIEAEGAGRGDNNGYMQILAGGGYRLPVTKNVFVKLQAAAGPAGGGGVDTGGGLLVDAGASLQYALSQRLLIEAALSDVRAPSAGFEALSAGLKLNYQYGMPSGLNEPVPWSALSGFDAIPLRLRVANQTYFKASDLWRNRSIDQSVSNLGVQADYFLSDHYFLTGQGLAAYAGDAGAYMIGAFGLGTHWNLSRDLFVEAEALVGAAGGGGLAVGGGFVGQGNASLGYKLSRDLSLMASVGRVGSFEGDFQANVIGLSLGYDFLGFTRQ